MTQIRTYIYDIQTKFLVAAEDKMRSVNHNPVVDSNSLSLPVIKVSFRQFAMPKGSVSRSICLEGEVCEPDHDQQYTRLLKQEYDPPFSEPYLHCPRAEPSLVTFVTLNKVKPSALSPCPLFSHWPYFWPQLREEGVRWQTLTVRKCLLSFDWGKFRSLLAPRGRESSL